MSKENLSDNKLIQAVLDGEIEKFGELIDKYERLVFSFLLARRRNLQEVEDVAQETFIKAFRHLGSFDMKRKFTSWLLTIAKNVLVDYVRKNYRDIASTELVTNVMLQGAGDTESNPQSQAIRKESFGRVIAMINSLPEEFREPFILRIVNEMAYQDISDALELPLQTVKNRIFKARALLREKRDNYEQVS